MRISPLNITFIIKKNKWIYITIKIGRNIGSLSNFMLMMKVKFAADKGELRYLSNTTPQATVNSQLIPTN